MEFDLKTEKRGKDFSKNKNKSCDNFHRNKIIEQNSKKILNNETENKYWFFKDNINGYSCNKKCEPQKQINFVEAVNLLHDKLDKLEYSILPEPVIFSPHYLGIPQHRERVYIMCVRKDIGEVHPFTFTKEQQVPCTIDSILQDDSEIPNIDEYRISPDMENLIDLWNEFIKNINVKKLPGFPVWSDRLCDLDPMEDLSQYPTWKQNFILKNNELYINNRKFIDDWLKKAYKNPLFFGAKAKLEWQAGQIKNPDIWNQIFQLRPSGIRIKVNTYFPALVAIVQTSIIGSRKRYLTPRECARLQSFPENFQPNAKQQQAYKQFGNAVNVECVKLFAKHMLNKT
jgi:DNA (cytosine-5)-methyltransferase 1